LYSAFRLAQKYIHYYLTASNGKGHGIHSPFVFDFVLNVLNDGRHYHPPADIEELRHRLLKDETIIEVADPGAGSRVQNTAQRKVGAIARSALKPKKYAELLYRLCRHYKPDTIVELGTSLGITTAYMAMANPGSKVATIEGVPAIAGLAQAHFTAMGIKNIDLHTGNFDRLLPQVLSPLLKVGMAYIDGNHRYEPTINYFRRFLSVADADSIFIFDDIHWSAEMEQAWEEIRHHPSVQYTIDVFFLGFVFFKKEFKVKQHFVIRF
jgi:predicted O-methyltransferase YrrM